MQPNLAELQVPSEYVTARGHIWPSMWSWEWWKRKHRDELVSAGALVRVLQRDYVNAPACDKLVVKIARETARRVRKAPE